MDPVSFIARIVAESGGPGLRAQPFFSLKTRTSNGASTYWSVWQGWERGRIPADWSYAFRARWQDGADFGWMREGVWPTRHPSVSCLHMRVPRAQADALVDILERVRLPIMPPPETELVGPEHSLRFYRPFFTVALGWYNVGPAAWSDLATGYHSIAARIDAMLEAPDAQPFDDLVGLGRWCPPAPEAV